MFSIIIKLLKSQISLVGEMICLFLTRAYLMYHSLLTYKDTSFIVHILQAADTILNYRFKMKIIDLGNHEKQATMRMEIKQLGCQALFL